MIRLKNPERFMWRVGHDPSSNHELRNAMYKQAQRCFSLVRESSAPQVFLRNEVELVDFIGRLPSDRENLSSDSSGKDPINILTKETIEKVYHLWDSTDSLRSPDKGRLLYGPREKLPKRFSLHLSQLLAMEEFLQTDKLYFFLFDDDIFVEELLFDFVEVLLDELPKNWHTFNFALPEVYRIQFQPHHRVSMNVSLPYFWWSPTALMMSREGVERYLYDFVFEVRKLEIGNSNIDKNIDERLNNITLYEPFDSPRKHWSMDSSENRKFNSYTFPPEVVLPIKIMESQSLY